MIEADKVVFAGYRLPRFHVRCFSNRSMELSLYQETPHPQTQEGAPKEPNADPGTLV